MSARTDLHSERALFEMQAVFCRTMGNPARLRIMHLLREGELCVNEISETLEASQPSVSQHLAVLRNAGVVSSRCSGRQHYYRLTYPEVATICDGIRDVLGRIARDRNELFEASGS
jgi:DNA-binding transcriptional ArsR family regulator